MEAHSKNRNHLPIEVWFNTVNPFCKQSYIKSNILIIKHSLKIIIFSSHGSITTRQQGKTVVTFEYIFIPPEKNNYSFIPRIF